MREVWLWAWGEEMLKVRRVWRCGGVEGMEEVEGVERGGPVLG